MTTITKYKDCDDAFVLEINDLIAFRAEHWEASEPTLKVVLSKRQLKKLYKVFEKYHNPKEKVK